MGRIGEARKNGTSPIAYTYELHDHLGTVRATINRVKSSGLAVIETWADYYADGEVMQGGTGAPRSGTGTLASRFGYQGQFAEKDPETGLLAFDLRMYDVTLGKWISPDPMSQDFSPYNGMGNNPVSMFDPTGGKWRPHTLAGKILKVAVVVVAVAAATAAVVMVPGVAGALGAICALDGTIIAGTVGGTALIGGAIGGTAAVFSLSNSSNPYNGTGGNSSNGTGGNVSNAIAQQQYQAQQTALTNMVNAANATYPADRDAAIAAANTTNLGDQSLPCPTGMEKSSGNGTESKTGLGNQNPPYTIDDVINKGLKNSPTIRNLYDQANRRGFSFSLTASNTPTTDPDKKSVVIPSSHSDIDQAVIDLAHELTNASNNNKYNRLDNRASDRTISRENYIRASIKLEMKGLLNQAKVIGEIGRPDLAANNLGGTFPSMYNDYIKGNLTENSLLNKMVDHAYNNFIVEGTQQMLKDYYGNDYDRLQP
jgi:RHS repeat-associated protein